MAFETFDAGGFERFCSGLVAAGFSPVDDTDLKTWTGPIRESLKPLTDRERMQVVFYDGWPLRYAHVKVEGLRAPHVYDGFVCLWADDDPAQVEGRNLEALWARVDAWAVAARTGFGVADQALDSYLLFDQASGYRLELPVGELLRGASNGAIIDLTAHLRTILFQVGVERDTPTFKGVLYHRRRIISPPVDLAQFRDALALRQRQHFERGLAARQDADIKTPSGGLDFAVLTWPRFDGQVDAIALGFSGHGAEVLAEAHAAFPSDSAARMRRAGSDARALTSKRVLVAGLGSIGGSVALLLAESGVAHIRGYDSDSLMTANLVRHVAGEDSVGYNKVVGVSVKIDDHAPWCDVEIVTKDLPFVPSELADSVQGFDLVVDCTGSAPMTAALCIVCAQERVPLITGALFHQGALLRIRRQAESDTPISARDKSIEYLPLPPDDTRPAGGFLEIGCTALVNSAPPWAAQRAAADIAAAVIDQLMGYRLLPDEQVAVLRPLAAPPFDVMGPVTA
ncbi:ThiF family adenylyltransferase [Kribbella sp. NPDC051936]|uniref:ThiF family adenylyltransferase n=1 Tax=Kribbella sp. NPDC051936 TaxID=3154946 RepID=UPI00342FC95F